MSEKKYCIAIDLGGTFIKGGIVSNKGEMVYSDKIPTQRELGTEQVIDNIAKICYLLLEKTNMTIQDVEGIGMGVPGMIDSATGTVIYWGNCNWEHLPLAKLLQEKINLPIKMANDANVAALGESKFGVGNQYKNTVMLTLGTGVGGGVVIDGKLFEGNRSAGAELGHMIIKSDGEACPCGNRGCLEAYASATALIQDTKRMMEAHKDSKMWEIGSLDEVTGKTSFDYCECDPYAKEVVERYIEMLSIGITNFANIFRPEAIILGGGVCAQRERLTMPIKEYVAKHIYAKERGPQVEILIAELGNDAGMFGAAALIF